MSKFIWYFNFPMYCLVVVYASIFHPRTGGMDYWWKIVKECHIEQWGKL